MSVPKLVLLRPLQSVVSLPARSRGVLPPDVCEVAQCDDEAKANSADVDGMSCSIERCVLTEVCEGRDKGAAVANYIMTCQETYVSS
jgi:hypothetical protein